MVYDYGCWMPGDGSLQEWLDAHQGPRQASDSRFVQYYIGVDLGRKRDPSTVVVVEAQYTAAGTAFYLGRQIKRFRLSMLYTDVASKLKKLDQQLRAWSAKDGKQASIIYLLDSGGVGEGVSELVTAALPEATIFKCYLTGGYQHSIDGFEIRVPKSQMVSALVAVFDANRISLPAGAREIDAMLDELSNYAIHISEEGRDVYGARVSKHDDLVCALGLAVWYAEHDGYAPGPMIW
jgi:hypothetical protein